MRMIPKDFIMRTLGGARKCWTVAMYILRSNYRNARLLEVPHAMEEPCRLMEIRIFSLVRV